MKSKLHLAAILFGALLAAAHADSAPASLLTNGDFESGTENWNVKDSDVAAKISQVLPEAAHAGKMGLRIQQAAGQSGSWFASNPISVTPQQTYRITLWVRTLSDSHAAVYFKFMGADGNYMFDTAAETGHMLQIPGDVYDWKQCQIDVLAPAGAATAAIVVHAYAKSECKADFDDFTVTQVTP